MGCYSSALRRRRKQVRVSPRHTTYTGMNYRFTTLDQDDFDQLLSCAYCLACDADRASDEKATKVISLPDACASLFALVYRLHSRVVTVMCRLLGDRVGYLVFVPDKEDGSGQDEPTRLLLVATTPQQSPHIGMALSAFKACSRSNGIEVVESLSKKQEATVSGLFAFAGRYMDLYLELARHHCSRYENHCTFLDSPTSTTAPSISFPSTQVICSSPLAQVSASKFMTVTLTSPPQTPPTPTERKD